MKSNSKKAALSREFENFLADIDSLLHATGDLTGEELREAREKMHDRVAEAREAIVGLSEDLTRRARKSAKSLDLEAHEEPWKAIGAGAAVGLLLGLLFARR